MFYASRFRLVELPSLVTTTWIIFVSLVWMGISATSVSATLYRFTDEEGVVHLTNKPLGDAVANVESQHDILVGTPHSTTSALTKRAPSGFDELIDEAAVYYSLPVPLVKAVIAAESGFDQSAVSSAGAQGLMQLLPETAKAMSVRNILDPRDNIFGGTRYLRLMLNRFDGNVVLAAAAYNAGPSAVVKANGIPRFAETQSYVKRVLELYRFYMIH